MEEIPVAIKEYVYRDGKLLIVKPSKWDAPKIWGSWDEVDRYVEKLNKSISGPLSIKHYSPKIATLHFRNKISYMIDMGDPSTSTQSLQTALKLALINEIHNL